MKTIIVITTLLIGNFAFGQSKQEQAQQLLRQAIVQIDNGAYEEAEKLLNQASKLDPQNMDYPYEIAYMQTAKKEYKKAIKTLEKLKKYPNCSGQVYQLQGNCYDFSGNPEKAIQTYDEGLKRFPNTGILYLERGNMHLVKQEYGKAMGYYEKGIQMDPSFPSNYYWASKIYCATDEEVWGMIYGELFLNLEQNSKRSKEISKLLYDTYASEIQFKDTTTSVSFSKNTIEITSIDQLDNLQLPFPLMVYEPFLSIACTDQHSIDLASLNQIRTKFTHMFINSEFRQTYPNVLFEYQQQVKEAGFMEAYNYWLLQSGNPDQFNNWYKTHETHFMAFKVWQEEHLIDLNESNKFYRLQYK